VDANKQCFRLTSEGQAAWRMRGSMPLPLDHRRILGLVDYAGHVAVIHSRLPRLLARQVDALLAELESARLIEAVPASEPALAELARGAEPPPIEPEDYAIYNDDSIYIDTSLSRLGVYIATDRVLHRAPCAKRPHETLVLLLEDDPDQRALAERRLTAAGYQVRGVDCVRAFYDAVGGVDADAILLDVNLPDGDGFEVLSVLRRHPSFTFMPIVMLTSRDTREDIVKGLALGADGYVIKSYYGPNTLDYVLRYVLQQEVASPPSQSRSTWTGDQMTWNPQT
jgi:two-component system OmpR family response regulator